MIKTFKKAISLILLAAFVLSLVPIAGMAEVVEIPSGYMDADAKPWIGSNVPNCSFYYAGSESAVNKNTSSVSGQKKNASEMAYSDGTFGKPGGDMVYLLRDSATKTGADLAQHGSYYNIGLTAAAGVPARTSDFAVEFSFALTDTTDKIQILTPMYTDYSKAQANGTSGATGYRFILSYANANFFGTSVAFENELNLNQWYNAVITYDVCADSSGQNKQNSYEYKLYINSELCASHSLSESLYGPRYIRMGTSSVGNSANVSPDNWVHYDNINSYTIPSDGSFVPSKPTASTLTSSDSAIEFIENTIAAPQEYTVKDLKDALISSKANDVIKYYNSDYTALKADSDLAINTNVVIASKTGDVEETFSYYTVEKWVKKYPGINPGIHKFTRGGSLATGVTSSFWKMESIASGLGGKPSDDFYLSYADESGSYYQSIGVDNASGTRDVLEMSVYIPENAKTVSLTLGIYDEVNDYESLPLLFKDDGIYTNFSSGANRFYSWEANKWYNIAIVSPPVYTGAVNSSGDSLDSNVVGIYVNGVLVDERAVTYSRAGFRHIRLSSSSITEDDISAYFDNIRVHSGTYEPQYDALDYISYVHGIGENNNIIVKGATTVAELKAGITKKEDTTIRVYRSLTSTEILSDGEYVQHGDVVVAAARNDSEMERSYNYYTIDRIKYETNIITNVNGAAGKKYDADDVLSATATFANYTEDSEYDVKLYAAQYKNGVLVNLWEDGAQLKAGQSAELSCDFAGMEDRENSSIKLMLVDENLNPYIEAAKMRFNSENTKATLYLLGDSIVQTYIDYGYPIQGWGYYIGDYLNDNITFENRATSGWTSDHYLYPDGIYTREDGVCSAGMELKNNSGNLKKVGTSNRYKIWSNILSELEEGDYVMVSLGINDMGSGNVPSDRYLENIETIYTQAVAKGATVIFSTPTISGKDWDSTGGFGEGWGGYGQICRQFADRNNSICIPLGATLVETYTNMANKYLEENPTATKKDANNYVRNYFHMYPASGGTLPDGSNDFGSLSSDDSTHHNYIGSNKVASIVAQLILESGSPLGDYVEIPQ